MIGPHVAPADVEAMIARQRAIDARLDADPRVREAREAYLRRLDAFEAARRDLEAASVDLGRTTASALREEA